MSEDNHTGKPQRSACLVGCSWQKKTGSLNRRRQAGNGTAAAAAALMKCEGIHGKAAERRALNRLLGAKKSTCGHNEDLAVKGYLRDACFCCRYPLHVQDIRPPVRRRTYFQP